MSDTWTGHLPTVGWTDREEPDPVHILSTNVYVGPNVWAGFPVIRHVVELGPLEGWPTGRLGDEFRRGLLDALPGLHGHGCSYREPGGFVRRLTEDDGTWLGHVWEHVTLELQDIAGDDVSFGRTRSRDEPGHYDMVFAYHDREVGLEACDVGRRLLLSLLPAAAAGELDDWYQQLDAASADLPGEVDWDRERDDFIRFAQRRALGPSTRSLVDAASARDIPWLRLNRQSLVQFGYGANQQRIQATITSKTPHVAVEIAQDKQETHRLLRDLGLPVPDQHVVQTADEAVAAVEALDGPVVCKPLDGNHGRGISIGPRGQDAVRKAFELARQEAGGGSVVLESYVPGHDHRMLVVDGRLVAVAKRVPGHVVGDGEHTVAELVDLVNEDPRRGVGHEKVLTRIELDRQAHDLLEAAGHSPGTVLPRGEVLHLRTTANLSTGGTATDLTDRVHPDNRTMAERAVGAVGLDVGGVDFLTEDITHSWKEVGGAMVEVNAAPGFRMHVAPSAGEPRDVAGAVMDMLFPTGRPARIPIAAITGTNGKTTTSRMVAHILKRAGHHVGLTTTDGVHVDGELTVKGDYTGPTAARMVLRDPKVDVAVMETARGGLVRAGLGFSHADVGAVLNISADHLGLGEVATLAQLAEVKRIVVEVARDTAILNADDELCLAMAEHTDAEHVCYVTMAGQHELVREHVRTGGRAVVLEEGINGSMITIYDRGAHVPLLWTHLIPATLEGRAVHNVQNAMFAAAIAHGMQVSLENIRQGLRTFDTTFFQAPGRLNLFTEHPFDVLMDYAHNPAAVLAVCATVDQFTVIGARRIVLAAPGDRRDEDVVALAQAAAGHFDHYVCRSDDDPRGRDPEEVPALLREALLEAGVDAGAIETLAGEERAVDHVLRAAGPGDLVVILADAVTRSWKQIVHFGGHERDEAAAGDDEAIADDVGIGSLLADGQYLHEERGVRLPPSPDD